ncbi:hypothetical protein CXG81DRAFT_24750 [Caulochytrium protostelioides]|uniref:Non-structural maintenance of chromosomes element 1 homolog n=1 Tax=Caulochytrium protostelioides TaxID=1555241 RepID=A0A4V1IV28_9FUNG|nr:hypothetical protein CXG81DRAFT_24750 [Caulochytrium protostelioides]|eukprot:RKP02609.1 hypothetical protein CXG81DRAFT_24750 [Caulochytrium protostelioides]
MGFDPEQYGDVHRLLLQSLSSRRMVTQPECQHLLAECILYDLQQTPARTPAASPVAIDVRRRDVAQTIATLNRALKPLGLAVAQAMQPDDGTRCYRLVDTEPDAWSAKATTLAPTAVAPVGALVQALAKAPRHGLSHAEAVAVPGVDGALLEQLIADGWLDRDDRSAYVLSMPAVLELQRMLADEYGACFKDCWSCQTLVVRDGWCCATCAQQFHRFCWRRYPQTTGLDPVLSEGPGAVCPACMDHASASATAIVEDNDY